MRGFKSGVLKFLVLSSIQQISSEEACKTDYASLKSLPRSIQFLHLDQACVEHFISNETTRILAVPESNDTVT